MNYASKIINEINKIFEELDNSNINDFIKEINKGKRIFVAGLGRSGFMIKSFAMRLMHLGFEVYVVGETITPSVEKGDLLIIGSGSGGTSSLVSMSREAKKNGAKIALVTTKINSSIGEVSDICIYLKAQSKGDTKDDITIQPMGSLFEQCLLIFFDALILNLMDINNKSKDKMIRKHANLE